MTENNNIDDVDPEMDSLLKEHFVQGTVVAVESIRNMIIQTHQRNFDRIQKLPEDFTKGWNTAFKTIAENLDKIGESFPKNELTTEEQFDTLMQKFKKAFPKK